ncbi:hypothetical protein R1flu_023594 [Riccia fluitans]|uniref:Uncharacterized protein n=1 Tax=Riccia fluitans TaxID=41844 RepID=A0ABD1XSG6_9MARC
MEGEGLRKLEVEGEQSENMEAERKGLWLTVEGEDLGYGTDEEAADRQKKKSRLTELPREMDRVVFKLRSIVSSFMYH